MKDYVSFSTAKKLKEKGYPQPTIENQYAGMKYNSEGVRSTAPYNECYACPELQDVQKWLREKRIYVNPGSNVDNGITHDFTISVYYEDSYKYIYSEQEYCEWEEALEQGIIKALDLL